LPVYGKLRACPPVHERLLLLIFPAATLNLP
jgi:hypothetical protein